MTHFEMVRANYETLKTAGHVVTLESVFDSTNKLIEMKIHHYLTCPQCIIDRHKAYPQDRIYDTR